MNNDYDRDRSSGWQHAKLSGHENEELAKIDLEDDYIEQDKFLSFVGKPDCTITKIEIGGLNEKNVPCVFENDTTKSKTDMTVYLDDGSSYNVSLKKSLSGQVYLITPERFILGIEAQYHITIPNNIKYAISLFWGTSDEVDSILAKYGTQINYEHRKHRVVGDTLKKYNQKLYQQLLDWFKENSYMIADFCFRRGLAKNDEDWADIIWYKNEIGENEVDSLFLIQDICDMVSSMAEDETNYGDRNGGTTIQLPFGFVQWHSPTKVIPGSMQFHHDYEKITNLLKKSKYI